jgi:hypothetical protein
MGGVKGKKWKGGKKAKKGVSGDVQVKSIREFFSINKMISMMNIIRTRMARNPLCQAHMGSLFPVSQHCTCCQSIFASLEMEKQW